MKSKKVNALSYYKNTHDLLKSKRADEPLMNQLIFFIIIIAFAVIMMAFVVRFGTQSSIKEEVYAKQIALAIDKARAGTNIVMDVSSIYKDGRKNNFENGLITIDNNYKKVTIHLSSGKGYYFGFFSSNPVVWNIDDSVKGEEKLILNIS